jgi:hypothetical protein
MDMDIPVYSFSRDPRDHTLVIYIDRKLKGEDRETVKSSLEYILRMFEDWLGSPIPRCYSDESCEQFPNHTEIVENYINDQKCEKREDWIDAPFIVADMRKWHWMRYRPHHDIIITGYVAYDVAYDFSCNGRYIISGVTWPIVNIYTDYVMIDFPGITIISVGSIKMLNGDDWQKAFLIEAAYQFGRLLGVPDRESPYYKSIPYTGGYCSYPYCVMGGRRDKKSIDEILRNNGRFLYCGPDIWYLRRNLEIVYGGQNKS